MGCGLHFDWNDMIKRLRNMTASNQLIADVGITIAVSATYEIPSQDYNLWAASEDILPLVVSGDIVVNDGNEDLPVRFGLALIDDNQMVLLNHYMLVQDDDLLIGNGDVLYYHDDLWPYDTMPAEEDDPA